MSTIGFLWNAYQQQQINNLESSKNTAKFEAHKAVQEEYMRHERRLEKLGLVCQAMWELIKDRSDLIDEDLLKMVTELDLKDGKLDGKYTKPPVDCQKCGAKICRKFNRCLFCGQEYSEGSAFDTV